MTYGVMTGHLPPPGHLCPRKPPLKTYVLWLRLSVSGVSSDVHEAFQIEAEARPRHLPVDPRRPRDRGAETELVSVALGWTEERHRDAARRGAETEATSVGIRICVSG